MRNKVFILILILIAGFAAGCSSIFGEDEEESYTISGRVFSNHDHYVLKDEGIEGHKVYLYNSDTKVEISTLTDTEGSYSFKNLSNGNYRVFCEDREVCYSFYPSMYYAKVNGKDLTGADFYRHRVCSSGYF